MLVEGGKARRSSGLKHHPPVHPPAQDRSTKCGVKHGLTVLGGAQRVGMTNCYR